MDAVERLITTCISDREVDVTTSCIYAHVHRVCSVIFRYFQISVAWLGINISVDKENAELLESDEPYVLVANHQAALDVLSALEPRVGPSAQSRRDRLQQ